MRANRLSILNAGWRSSSAIAERGVVQLVETEAHPELRGLVLDDEQQLVVGIGEWMLSTEHVVEVEVVAVRHPPVERHRGTVIGRIERLGVHDARVGGLPGGCRPPPAVARRSVASPR